MSGEQLGLELANIASQVAMDHADVMEPGWSERAFSAFKIFAKQHDRFSTEDVIAASAHVPAPPDKRAWGGIARKACHSGVCEKAGMGTSKLPHAHQRPITIWNSKIFQG